MLGAVFLLPFFPFQGFDYLVLVQYFIIHLFSYFTACGVCFYPFEKFTKVGIDAR